MWSTYNFLLARHGSLDGMTGVEALRALPIDRVVASVKDLATVYG